MCLLVIGIRCSGHLFDFLFCTVFLAPFFFSNGFFSMRFLFGLLVVLLVLLRGSLAFAHSHESVSHSEWEKFFEKAGVQGTVVFKELGREQRHFYDFKRAQKRKIPASTFKVIHSLIAYETGTVQKADHLFKWDGKPQWLKAWERDLTFHEAIKVSAVPVYKRIAKSIGSQRMKYWLNRLSYGNGKIDGGIDKFWLSGELRVSAIEQVDFLEKLYKGSLDASLKGQAFVRDILPVTQHKCFEIKGKTGLAFRKDKPHIGWWIGWAKAQQRVMFFALNIDIKEKKQYGLRQSIVVSLLEQGGLFEENFCAS